MQAYDRTAHTAKGGAAIACMMEDLSPQRSLSAPLLEEEVWDADLAPRAASDSVQALRDAHPSAGLPTIESSHELLLPISEARPHGAAGASEERFGGTSPQPSGMVVGARRPSRTQPARFPVVCWNFMS